MFVCLAGMGPPLGRLHLAADDQGARARGSNLSADSVLAFDDDIDAESRPALPEPWCIGADEE